MHGRGNSVDAAQGISVSEETFRYYEVRRTIETSGGLEDVWRVLCKIGGRNGWYYADGLWDVREGLDFFFGTTYGYTGKKVRGELSVGDMIDFWHVTVADPGLKLLLVTDMELWGDASLEFEIAALDESRTRIIQTARFVPHGLHGVGYWMAMRPFHKFIFQGMIREIARRAARRKRARSL